MHTNSKKRIENENEKYKKLANLFCGYYQRRYGAAFGLPFTQVALSVEDVREIEKRERGPKSKL